MTSLCGDPPDRNAFLLWDVWAFPWTTHGRSVWSSSVCGKISRAALGLSGLQSIEKMSLYIASSRHDILKRQHCLPFF